jgi:hypothetical protein
MKTKKLLQIRMKAEDYIRLKKTASENDQPAAAFARLIILNFLSQEEAQN